MLAPICWLHVTAEKPAVDFRPFAVSADYCLPNLRGHRLAQFVRQNKTRLIRGTEIAGHRQHALALHFIAENRYGHEVAA